MPTELLHSLASNVWSWFLIALFFGGSIFVHELGHFLAARWRGAHVERFSIGFGPKIFSWRRGGTEFCLSLIPIGGYVLLPQLADLSAIEGISTTDVSKLPPVSYLSKVIVFVAGAAFNILFAFALACVVWVIGQPVAEEDQTTRIGALHAKIETSDGRTVASPAAQAGLQVDDVIRAIDGQPVTTFSQIAERIALGSGRDASGNPKAEITFERNGRTQTVTVFPQLVGPERSRDIGAEPAVRVAVASVQADSPAAAAGLQPGDVITQLDGQSVGYVGFVADYLKTGQGKPVHVTYLRDGHAQNTEVLPRKFVDPDTKTEVFRFGVILRGGFTEKIIHAPPWIQLQEHLLRTWHTLLSLINPHSDIGLANLNGPIGIAEHIQDLARFDFRLVLWLVILLNVNLAIFNLLPIPVLDGGQILFATISKLRGRALPVNIVVATQSLFIVLIISMMLYVSFFDVRRWARDVREEKAVAHPAAPVKP